jgi:hypothetical protein
VKTEPKDDDKENALESVPEISKRPTRPTIGNRQSTRSVALVERIREFEIVSQMLQVAMAQEGDNEGQEQTESEAAITIAKLRANLAQAVDQESVEAQVEDVEIPEPSADLKEDSGKPDTATQNDDEVTSLREQLSESQGLVDTLSADLEQLKDKLANFSASAEEESRKVQEVIEAIRSEHAEKVDSLLTSHKQEMDRLRADTKDEIEQKSSSHYKEAAALQSELAEANVSLASHEENASKIESMRDAHAKELDVLQKRVEEFKGKATSHEENVSALRTELAETKARLAGHDATVIELESLKSAHAQELDTLQQQTKDAEGIVASHSQELMTLQAELEEAKTALSKHQERSAWDIKREDHQAALREIEEAKTSEIDNLKQTHLAEIDDLQAKLERAAQTSTKNAAMQETEISHLGQVIETLQNEIQASGEAQTEAAEARLTAIKEEHEKAMSAAVEQAKSSSSGELESLRQALTAEFQITIDELQSELKNAREQASKSVEDANAASEEQIRVLEAKVRNLRVEMDASRMQTATLKQILSSSERENQEKDEVHAEAISNLEQEVEMSVKRATEQQMKVMDLSMRLDQEVTKRSALENTHAKAVEDMEAEHEATKQYQEETRGNEIKSLKNQHAENIKGFRSKEEALTRQLDDLQVKHDSMAKQLQAQEETHSQSVKDLQSKHDDAFKEMQDAAAARQQELESLKTERANAVESSEALIASHKLELETLQIKHDLAVKDLDEKLGVHVAQQACLTTQIATHSETVSALEATHAEQVEAIKAQHSEDIFKLMSDADAKDIELTKANTQYAEMVRKLEMSSRRDAEFEKLTIQNTNMATELKSNEASHSAYLEELRKSYMDEIKAAETATKTHAIELEQLKAQQNDLIKALENSKDVHAKAISDLKSQHIDQLTKLQAGSKDQAAELEKLKMRVEEETKTTAAAHNREVKELQAQHAATMEAMADAQVVEIEKMKKQHVEALQKATTFETVAEGLQADSSKTAETTKEMQIKIASLEAELALSKKTDTPRSKSPKKKKSRKSINGSGSPGLAHSMWAQGEPTTPLKQEYGTMRGGSGDDEPSQAETTEISSTAPTSASVPRKYNIEGQIAGIQEQLKHLDDVDAEMLEQHERMARTLSRVYDANASEET